MQPQLRNPSSTWDIVSFVKIMTGEVRVRASEEKVESRMRPTLTNKFTTISQQLQCLPFQLQQEWNELQSSCVKGLQQTKDVL
eukprot:2596347-Prorocentrum_lima.AAC.1